MAQKDKCEECPYFFSKSIPADDISLSGQLLQVLSFVFWLCYGGTWKARPDKGPGTDCQKNSTVRPMEPWRD